MLELVLAAQRLVEDAHTEGHGPVGEHVQVLDAHGIGVLGALGVWCSVCVLVASSAVVWLGWVGFGRGM